MEINQLLDNFKESLKTEGYTDIGEVEFFLYRVSDWKNPYSISLYNREENESIMLYKSYYVPYLKDSQDVYSYHSKIKAMVFLFEDENDASTISTSGNEKYNFTNFSFVWENSLDLENGIYIISVQELPEVIDKSYKAITFLRKEHNNLSEVKNYGFYKTQELSSRLTGEDNAVDYTIKLRETYIEEDQISFTNQKTLEEHTISTNSLITNIQNEDGSLTRKNGYIPLRVNIANADSDILEAYFPDFDETKSIVPNSEICSETITDKILEDSTGREYTKNIILENSAVEFEKETTDGKYSKSFPVQNYTDLKEIFLSMYINSSFNLIFKSYSLVPSTGSPYDRITLFNGQKLNYGAITETKIDLAKYNAGQSQYLSITTFLSRTILEGYIFTGTARETMYLRISHFYYKGVRRIISDFIGVVKDGNNFKVFCEVDSFEAIVFLKRNDAPVNTVKIEVDNSTYTPILGLFGSSSIVSTKSDLFFYTGTRYITDYSLILKEELPFKKDTFLISDLLDYEYKSQAMSYAFLVILERCYNKFFSNYEGVVEKNGTSTTAGWRIKQNDFSMDKKTFAENVIEPFINEAIRRYKQNQIFNGYANSDIFYQWTTLATPLPSDEVIEREIRRFIRLLSSCGMFISSNYNYDYGITNKNNYADLFTFELKTPPVFNNTFSFYRFDLTTQIKLITKKGKIGANTPSSRQLPFKNSDSYIWQTTKKLKDVDWNAIPTRIYLINAIKILAGKTIDTVDIGLTNDFYGETGADLGSISDFKFLTNAYIKNTAGNGGIEQRLSFGALNNTIISAERFIDISLQDLIQYKNITGVPNKTGNTGARFVRPIPIFARDLILSYYNSPDIDKSTFKLKYTINVRSYEMFNKRQFISYVNSFSYNLEFQYKQAPGIVVSKNFIEEFENEETLIDKNLYSNVGFMLNTYSHTYALKSVINQHTKQEIFERNSLSLNNDNPLTDYYVILNKEALKKLYWFNKYNYNGRININQDIITSFHSFYNGTIKKYKPYGSTGQYQLSTPFNKTNGLNEKVIINFIGSGSVIINNDFGTFEVELIGGREKTIGKKVIIFE